MPSSFVIALTLTLVAREVIVTTTPGTIAPDASTTRPVIVEIPIWARLRRDAAHTAAISFTCFIAETCLLITVLNGQCSLEHRLGVGDIIHFSDKSATAGILVLDTALAVDIQRTRMLRIQTARIFLPDEFPHHRKHVDHA